MAETQFKYDVFLSHNSKDKAAVEKIARVLRDEYQLKVWLDKWNLIPGRDSQEDLESGLKDCKTIAVFLGKVGFGKWENKEMRAAINTQINDPSRRVIPVRLPGSPDKPEFPALLGLNTWVDLRTGFDTKDSLYLLYCGIIGREPGDFSKPYTPHLIPETHWFYGHRYGDLENFTGRTDEMKMLDEWLGNDKDNLLVLTAFGGFGKSALTWQWFNNRVDKTKWRTAIWWSFYEKESGFESFLAETLAHLGVEVKESARQQVNDLLEAMRGTNILIVLDGFERLLRQYGRMDAALQPDDEDADIDPSQRDCSSPLAETFLRGLSGAGMRSKVLMTTRLCPRVLESADGKLLKGCRDEALSAFSPEDAVTYFHNEGIKATRAEVLALCAAYGYHPLSLSLLVGLINEDHEKRGDIAAVKNLEIFEDVKARRHHVLERAYGSLAPERRELLSKISCFRGSMEYAVLKKVFPSPDLGKSLLDLRQRGLLQYAGETQRYDMHPIVRHYAYDRFTDSERKKTHKDLAFHFIDVMIDVMPMPNTKVKTLEDLAPVIELYHHMVGAGNLDEAAEHNMRRCVDLCREIGDKFSKAIGHQELGRVLPYFGAWQEADDNLLEAQSIFDKYQTNYRSVNWSYRALRFLLMAREEAIFDTRHSNDESRIANNEYRQSAIECAQRALEVADDMGKVEHSYPVDFMRAYLLLGTAYRENKDLNKAEENLSKTLDICRQINMVYFEADILLELAKLRYAQGDFKDAQEKASEALVITERCGYVLQGADVNLFLAQYALEQEKHKAKAKVYAEEAKKLATCDGPPYYYKVAYEEAEKLLASLNV